MANTTFFLTEPAVEHIEPHVVKAQRTIDFSKKAVTPGNTLDVFNIPVGAVILNAGVVANVGQAGLTVTLGHSTDSGNDNLFSSADVGTTGNFATVGASWVPVYSSTDTVLRSVVGGASATSAVLTYYVVYAVIK